MYFNTDTRSNEDFEPKAQVYRDLAHKLRMFDFFLLIHDFTTHNIFCKMACSESTIYQPRIQLNKRIVWNDIVEVKVL